MLQKFTLSKTPSWVVAALALSACQTVESQRIELASYSPVIDVSGQGYDQAEYLQDLHECRQLGVTVQARYEAQRKKEQEQAMNQAIAGAFIGALVGHAIGSNNDYHTGRSATAGALYGGAIAGVAGADAIDYSRVIAKFGPTAVVDRCMQGRGYKILSIEGFGGGS